MTHDNLGPITNALLTTADDFKNGAMNGRCTRLTQLPSSAVGIHMIGQAISLLGSNLIESIKQLYIWANELE
ncbi:hypothetical protein BC941DRAFT_465639 [Chlamydoabsidia padenii]|nr:hypothetical protein BC941DRAFT_465639 [Chlamydoabsidia padenii]